VVVEVIEVSESLHASSSQQRAQLRQLADRECPPEARLWTFQFVAINCWARK
jgi:hypothetical protein